MNKSNLWRLGFATILVLLSFALISPLEDRNLGDYALNQVTSEANSSDHQGHETFAEVLENIENELPEGSNIDYGALRSYGLRNRLNYAAFFEPPSSILGTISSRLIPFVVKPGIRSGHIKDRDERNDLVLRTLLRNSQAAIKKG